MRMTIVSINKLLSSELEALDGQLKARSQTKVEMINTLSDHIISSGGKRLRPIVLMLSAYASDPNAQEKVIDASVVVEFIHAATLLHDDVVDMSKIRHSKDTANIIWGNKGAVLVGDFLYSRAFEIIVEINRSLVYETLAKTTNIIAQGEVLQLMNVGNIDLDEELYLDIIYRKTAILFEASAKIGSILSDGKYSENLASFGLHFGKAYQLRNDYLDYFGEENITGKNIAEDLSEGKSTLPLIHSFNSSNDQDQKDIKEIFNGKIISKAEELLEIFKQNKSDIYTQEQINKYSNQAIKSLEIFEGKDKDMLVELTKLCTQRTR